MNTKILILFLVLASLFVSGCAEDAETASEAENAAGPGSVEEGLEETLPVGPGEEHIVRLVYYEVFIPSELEVARGDTVAWWSERRQGTFVLVSEDGLFPNEELAYRVPFKYTFNEVGSYSFAVEDIPEMNLTVTVD